MRTPTEFSRFIMGHGAQDDERFSRLALVHLSNYPEPWGPECFSALELEVLEPSARASLLAAKVNDEIPEALFTRSRGPGRL